MPYLFATNLPPDGDNAMMFEFMRLLAQPEMLERFNAPPLDNKQRRLFLELLPKMLTASGFKSVRGPMNQHMLRNVQNHGNTFPAPKYFDQFSKINNFVNSGTDDMMKRYYGLMSTE